MSGEQNEDQARRIIVLWAWMSLVVVGIAIMVFLPSGR